MIITIVITVNIRIVITTYNNTNHDNNDVNDNNNTEH